MNPNKVSDYNKEIKDFKGPKPEYLSNDILDTDFLKSFSLFHRMQFLLGCCRVDPKDQFVTAPTVYQKIYSVICILTLIAFNIYMDKTYFSAVTDYSFYCLIATAMWQSAIPFFLYIIHARFFNAQLNAEFIVRMQKIDRLMRVDRIHDVNIIMKRIHTVSIITLAVTFIGIFISYGIRNQIEYVGSTWGELGTMAELIFCSNLVVYFVIRIKFINCIMKNHLNELKNVQKDRKKSRFLLKTSNFMSLASESHKFSECDTNSYLRDLFDCFEIFQNLYRFQLLIFCFKLVFASLINFGLLLLAFQKNTLNAADIIFIIIYTLMDVLTIVFLGIRLQMFFSEINETKRLSVAIMAAYVDGPLRDKAKKMLKIVEETPPRLSVYDMWDMDAGIVVTIFSLVTSLIVTLLQFAIL